MDEITVYFGDVDRPTLIDDGIILLDVAATQNAPCTGAAQRRGGYSEDARKDPRSPCRFNIPVRDIAFWSDPGVVRQPVSTLTLLSKDRYAIAFKATCRISPPLEYLDLSSAGPPASFVPDRVVLFSGRFDFLLDPRKHSLVRMNVLSSYPTHHPPSSLAVNLLC